MGRPIPGELLLHKDSASSNYKTPLQDEEPNYKTPVQDEGPMGVDQSAEAHSKGSKEVVSNVSDPSDLPSKHIDHTIVYTFMTFIS